MLLNPHLRRLCEAILTDSIGNKDFGDMVVAAGVKLEEKEWDIANKLLEKSEEICHAAGGRDKRTVH